MKSVKKLGVGRRKDYSGRWWSQVKDASLQDKFLIFLYDYVLGKRH